MMLEPLIPYLLKKKRLDKKLTIEQVCEILHFDKTYLSKVENNKISPAERKLRQLYLLYGIKTYSTTQLNFSVGYIHHLFEKIYYMQLDENDLVQLDCIIAQHKNSIYLGHLCLVKWCYKALNGLWDKEFLSEQKSFIALFNLLTLKEQNLFLLCLMFYFTRNKQLEYYKEYETKLAQLQKRYWLGLEYYIKTSFAYNSNNLQEMLVCIKQAKHYLKNDQNIRRLSSVMQYEAIYFNSIGNYDKEIEIYGFLAKLYKSQNLLVNYGVTLQNIASLLLYQKNYDSAIEYYIEGLKYNSLNGPYFELAWCYYMINERLLCRKCIKEGKQAQKQLPVYSDLLDWLHKMLETPYSKSCLNLLLKIENQYSEILNTETANFLYIAIANTYKELKELDKAYYYLSKVINKNITTSLYIK